MSIRLTSDERQQYRLLVPAVSAYVDRLIKPHGFLRGILAADSMRELAGTSRRLQIAVLNAVACQRPEGGLAVDLFADNNGSPALVYAPIGSGETPRTR